MEEKSKNLKPLETTTQPTSGHTTPTALTGASHETAETTGKPNAEATKATAKLQEIQGIKTGITILNEEIASLDTMANDLRAMGTEKMDDEITESFNKHVKTFNTGAKTVETALEKLDTAIATLKTKNIPPETIEELRAALAKCKKKIEDLKAKMPTNESEGEETLDATKKKQKDALQALRIEAAFKNVLAAIERIMKHIETINRM